MCSRLLRRQKNYCKLIFIKHIYDTEENTWKADINSAFIHSFIPNKTLIELCTGNCDYLRIWSLDKTTKKKKL